MAGGANKSSFLEAKDCYNVHEQTMALCMDSYIRILYVQYFHVGAADLHDTECPRMFYLPLFYQF